MYTEKEGLRYCMKGYRPSEHCDADVDLETQARRAGPRQHQRKTVKRKFDLRTCTKAKLTYDDVRWIRKNWNQDGGTWTIAAMARKLKVAHQAVSQVCHRKSWKEVL